MTIGRITLYEGKYFSTGKRVRTLRLSQYSPNTPHSLHAIDFKDCLSSMKWNLPVGVRVTFWSDFSGKGEDQYIIEGSGSDDDTLNNDFGDKASSWEWVEF
jgi:hypothetical protein